MLAPTTKRPMTFEEFEQTPETPRREELRAGVVHEVPIRFFNDYLLQTHLAKKIDALADRKGLGVICFGFKPLPQYEFWYAHVAYVSRTMWYGSDRQKYFDRAPELVVEIPFRDDSAEYVTRKRRVCLENGALEFWEMYIEQHLIVRWTPDGRALEYKRGDSIQLFFAPGATLGIDSIFEEPRETA